MKKQIITISAALTLSLSFAAIGDIESARAQSWWGSSPGKNSVSDRQVVKIDKRLAPNQLIVSFGDRRLYHVVKRGRAISYPIGVPRPRSRWRGVEYVSMKRINPPWTPTASMRRENPRLPVYVPGGHPRNPLGVRAIYLGNTLYRIHGTDAPWTVGQNVSKGCIRMHNDHVIELYKRVRVGMKVTATWDQIQIATLSPSNSRAKGGGGSFLQVR